jgi:hypothetical protein
MPTISIAISRLTDEHFPGWVECVLVDAINQSHLFVEKVPVVTNKNLLPTSTYSQSGELGCEVEAQWQDTEGRFLIRVNTQRPWGIESIAGITSFVVLASQVRHP